MSGILEDDESSDDSMLEAALAEGSRMQMAQNTPSQIDRLTQESSDLLRFATRTSNTTVPARVSLGHLTATQETLIPTQENAFAPLEKILIDQSQARRQELAARQLMAPPPSIERVGNARPQLNTAASKKRGPKITDEEVLAILDTIEEVLPLGAQQWARVARRHTANGWPDRSVDVLKRRYQGLLKKANQVPTGDPHIPEEVKRVREVQAVLRSSAQAADPSQENGGVSQVFHGASAATAEQTQQIASDMEESGTTGTSGLDSTRPLSNVASRGGGRASSAMDVLLRTQELSIKQQIEARQQEAQDRKEERKRLREERKEKSEQMDKLLALAAMGIYAWIGSQPNAQNNPTAEAMGSMVKEMVTKKSKTNDDDESESSSIG